MKENGGYVVFYNFIAKTRREIMFKDMTVAANTRIATLGSYICENKLVICVELNHNFDNEDGLVGIYDSFEEVQKVNFFKLTQFHSVFF